MATSIVRSSSFQWAVGGWSFFIVENLVLSENRGFLIEKLGDDGYHAAYGTLSTAAMASVAYAYFTKLGAGPMLWVGKPPLSHKIAALSLLTLGLGMASQTLPKFQVPVAIVPTSTTQIDPTAGPTTSKSPMSFKVRCPFDFTDKPSDDGAIHGLERISRHPGLWSMGLIGFGHSFLVPNVPKKAWLCMPLLVAMIGGGHTDSRHRRGMGGVLMSERDRLTSNIPFAAMLQNGGWGELANECKLLNAAISAGVAGVWVWHTGRVPKAVIMASRR